MTEIIMNTKRFYDALKGVSKCTTNYSYESPLNCVSLLLTEDYIELVATDGSILNIKRIPVEIKDKTDFTQKQYLIKNPDMVLKTINTKTPVITLKFEDNKFILSQGNDYSVELYNASYPKYEQLISNYNFGMSMNEPVVTFGVSRNYLKTLYETCLKNNTDTVQIQVKSFHDALYIKNCGTDSLLDFTLLMPKIIK